MAVLQTEWIGLAEGHSKERFSHLVGDGIRKKYYKYLTKKTENLLLTLPFLCGRDRILVLID
jgi:hypothetical protein